MNRLGIYAFLVIILFSFPVLFLVYEGLGPLLNEIGYSSIVINSIVLTLFSSLIASIIHIFLLTPAAYYMARHSNPLLETLADIPASVPHPIVGISLILLNSGLTPIGRLMQSLGINFFNTILGLVIALSIISAPIYLKSIEPYFSSMNRDNELFAMSLGASEFRTFTSVILPNSLKGIVGASLISISRSMSEFGSIAIVAYTVLQEPFYGILPAPVLIYQYYVYYGLGASITASAIMVAIGAALMLIVRLVRRQDKRVD